jgi:hypothetical protein
MKTPKFYNQKQETCGHCFAIWATLAILVVGFLLMCLGTKQCEPCTSYEYGYTYCKRPIAIALDEYEGCMEKVRAKALFCSAVKTMLEYTELPQTELPQPDPCDDLWAFHNVSRCENELAEKMWKLGTDFTIYLQWESGESIWTRGAKSK